MKILHVLAKALRGGCEMNCYHFIKSTPAYKHEVIVLDQDGPMTAKWQSLGVKVATIEILRSGLWRFIKSLPELLPNDLYDSVIVWTTIRMPIILHVLNKYKGAQIFVHVGNPVANGFVGDVKNMMLKALYPSSNKVQLRSVSAFVQKSLERSLYYRLYDSKVSLKPIVTGGERVYKPIEVGVETSFRIGMVARLDPIKDHITVLRAFKLVKQVYTKAELHLVGDGVLRNNLESLAVNESIDRVTFHGSSDDVHEEMRSWSLFLYATTLSEGLGGTIPEALSIGLPVVSCDLPMIREWDREGTFITFCKPFDPRDMADKAIEVLRNVDHRNYVYENAPSYIKEHFSPDAFARNYISK